MKTPYIGIDNGLDGAIVVVENGQIVHATAMPVIKLGKGRRVDPLAIVAIIGKWGSPTVIIEQASKHSPGKLALCSTWRSFGAIETVCELTGVRYDVVHPRTWQKAFWATPKMPAGQKFDTKAAAQAAANKIWPGREWLKTPRCSTPHDGMIDAALIAEWARRAGI